MCRATSSGGRRCPGPKSKEHRDQINAERREKYAFNRDLPKNLEAFKAPKVYRVSDPGCSIELSQSWDAKLSKKEEIVMEDFTGMASHDINRYLYSKTYRDALDADDPSTHNKYMIEKYGEDEAREMRVKARERLIESIGVIDNILAKATLPEATVVYRGHRVTIPKGVKPLDYIASQHKMGSEFSVKNYASTSLNPAVGAYFAGKQSLRKQDNENKVGVVYEMLTTEGAPIRTHSAVEVEDEVLLPRDKKFRVAGIHEKVTFESIDVDEETDRIFLNHSKQKHIVIRLIEV